MVDVPDTTLLVHAVESAPDGVLIVDSDGTVVYANRSMHAMAGTDDLVGRAVEELVPADRRGYHSDRRAMYLRSPSQRPMGAGLRLEMQRVDGSLLPVEISLSPLSHDGDDGDYVVVAVRDVTEREESRSRLAAANEQLALVAERERIGRDLHDVILQHLYGMGLGLQASASLVEGPARQRIEGTIDDIDHIISEVRTIVFTLGSAVHQGALGQELADVVAQASRVLGFTPSLRLVGPVESALSPEVRTEMVASMREALGNVARHARASRAKVVVELADDAVVMSVTDNGVGPPEEARRGGHGLANLQQRAAAFGGSCCLERVEEGGSRLRWSARY